MQNTVKVWIQESVDTWTQVNEVHWVDGILILKMEKETATYPAHSVVKVVASLEEEK
jgi:hypothetical protein